jgi:hypothetical protein
MCETPGAAAFGVKLQQGAMRASLIADFMDDFAWARGEDPRLWLMKP